MTLRKTLPLLALLASFVPLGFAPPQDKDEEGFVSLFNGKDLSGFTSVLDRSAENGNGFAVRDGVIISDSPRGYLATERSYKNYVLRFDWKLLEGNQYFGCLILHITGRHKFWPTGVLLSRGKIFSNPLDPGKINYTIDEEAHKKAIKTDEWNTTEIISNDGELTCKVNGIQISTGKGSVTEGPIGWQFGSQSQLKNIRIKETE